MLTCENREGSAREVGEGENGKAGDSKQSTRERAKGENGLT